jgi:molybdate transport system substrate-binding protein
MILDRRVTMLTLAALGACAPQGRPSGPLVFAAASMTDVLQACAPLATAPPTFSFAASSLLARQIADGAAADLFVSADEHWMDHLAARGLVDAASRRIVARGRLALVARAGANVSLRIEPGFPLAEALGQERLALADPAAAPAGRYAQAALKALGAWDSIGGKYAAVENVRAALAFVARGEAKLGIVYESDARIEPRVEIVGLFPDGSHEPIVFPAALLASAPNRKVAAAFLERLTSGEAQATFARFGFRPA